MKKSCSTLVALLAALAVSHWSSVAVRGQGLPNLNFQLAFNNPNANAGVFFQDYTLNGPAGGGRLLPADRVLAAGGDRYYYGAKPHVVWRADAQTGAILEMDPGSGMPELSWPMGVAFDSHRSRVVLTSLGGEGFFYAYSPISNLWSLVRSQDNRDLDCLEYHANLDALFGVKVLSGDGGPATIYRFGADGAFAGEIALPTLPFGIGPTGYRSELVSVGDYLVLLLEADPFYDPYGESRIYLIDPRNGDVQLTYQHVTPRPNHPPSVQINSPSNGQLFGALAQVHLVAYAQDLEDGFNLTVEFFEGSNSLGFGIFVPSLCPSPYCPNFALTWSNVPPGQYTLTAKARDTNGATTVSAPVQITVYDPAFSIVTISATDASASEAGGTGTFTVSRAGNTTDELNVFYSISGTASNGVDYVALSNSVIIPGGAGAATIQITPIDDALYEGTEKVELRLVPPPIYLAPYVIASPSNAVVIISDNESPPPPPVVTIQATDALASETPGNPGQFTVYRTGPTNQSLHVFWAISGTASNGVDYVRLTNTVFIPAGSASVQFAVTPIDDTLVEGTETVVATFYDPPIAGPLPFAYTIGSPSNATVTILDNDPAPPPPTQAIVTIEATDPNASEPGVLTVIDPGVFTVYRSGNTSATLHVQYRIEGTASNGLDYAAISNIVVIPAGATFARIIINPLHDNLPEGTETVVIRLQDPICIAIFPPPPECYHVGTPGVATVNITDNDGPTNTPPIVTITASDPVASEGTNCLRWPGWPTPLPASYCGTNTATFVVRRTGETNAPLSVRYEIGGTASNGVDYAALPGAITIPAGRRAAELRVVPIDDLLPERIETVVLALINPPISPATPPPYVVGQPRRAGAIIVDNDQPRPTTGPLPDRCFHLMQPGTNGAWFRIECSTDLVNWTPICTNNVTDGAIHFVDPDADASPSRFYRAVPEPNPPLE